jgi:hypothetical protein
MAYVSRRVFSRAYFLSISSMFCNDFSHRVHCWIIASKLFVKFPVKWEKSDWREGPLHAASSTSLIRLWSVIASASWWPPTSTLVSASSSRSALQPLSIPRSDLMLSSCSSMLPNVVCTVSVAGSNLENRPRVLHPCQNSPSAFAPF